MVRAKWKPLRGAYKGGQCCDVDVVMMRMMRLCLSLMMTMMVVIAMMELTVRTSTWRESLDQEMQGQPQEGGRSYSLKIKP